MAVIRKKPNKLKEISFDFIKSNLFRVIRCDGAFGGLAPNGSIHMAIYSERQAIPTKTVHKFDNGQLGQEILSKREGRSAVVREIEVDISMDVRQAKVLRDWLSDKISQHQDLVNADGKS